MPTPIKWRVFDSAPSITEISRAPKRTPQPEAGSTPSRQPTSSAMPQLPVACFSLRRARLCRQVRISRPQVEGVQSPPGRGTKSWRKLYRERRAQVKASGLSMCEERRKDGTDE